VKRAVNVFDRVVIAIAADTGSKAPLFDLEDRVELARSALEGIDGVEVASYKGLTVDFARDNGLSDSSSLP
jgi:pantetheine-phosphate adenylyltransferase